MDVERFKYLDRAFDDVHYSIDLYGEKHKNQAIAVLLHEAHHAAEADLQNGKLVFNKDKTKLNDNQLQAINGMLRRRFDCVPVGDIFPWTWRYMIATDSAHIIAKNPFLTDPQWVCRCNKQDCKYLVEMLSSLKVVFG